VDNTGEVTGFSAEGLVMKLLANHFTNALPVTVGGNSPQQAVPGTPWVDIPKVPIGSPTYPLDVTAALSSDRKKLIFSVVNPTEEKQGLSPKVTGVKLRGTGKLFQISPPSLTSANLPGQKPAVEIVEHPQASFPETLQIPPVSIGVYEFEIERA
jgi:alpha-N-arabinofuranosidase